MEMHDCHYTAAEAGALGFLSDLAAIDDVVLNESLIFNSQAIIIV